MPATRRRPKSSPQPAAMRSRHSARAVLAARTSPRPSIPISSPMTARMKSVEATGRGMKPRFLDSPRA
ncbi:MAG: hypothetical protein BWZ02_03224 [Lentisphaerae bacterium ADurb.BinA184]|nr:MAG: hypothetical protein BWZ02_03224 [Lentisphaerae bacterium ADurb.BinA184]